MKNQTNYKKPYIKIYKKKHKIKKDEKIVKSDDTEIEECKFHQNKSPMSIKI